MLSACQGGGGGSTSAGAVVGGADGVVGIQLGGGGADGPVVGGMVEFFDADNNSCGDVVQTNDSGKYTAVIPLDCKFPLRISLTDGYDLVGKHDNHTEMLSFVSDEGMDTANITPLTSIIYYALLARAESLGIPITSPRNLDFVSKIAMRYFNFGIDNAAQGADVAYNPITSEINADNACAFVKSNEGLIETIRRTAIYWQNAPASMPLSEAITLVMQALGGDIADGVLDGHDISGVSVDGGHLAALWNLNAATVSMELMQNQFSITQEDGTILPPDNSRLLSAAEQVSNTAFVDADIDNTNLPLGFITQARAAAVVADALISNSGTSPYATFANLLTTMKAEAERGMNAQALTAARAQQLFTLNPVIIPTPATVTTIAADIGAGDSTGGTFDLPLKKSSAVIMESTSVPSPAGSRYMNIKWSYPNSTPNLNGFKIYITVNGQAPQICVVASAGATEAACPVDAGPGDHIEVSMTATTSTAQESAHSTSYSNIIPTAKFTADNIAGECGKLTTNFDASGTGSPVLGANRRYDWGYDGAGTHDYGITVNKIFDYSSNVLLAVTDTTDGVFSTTGKASLDVDCW